MSQTEESVLVREVREMRQQITLCNVHPDEIRRWVKMGLMYFETGKGMKFLRADVVRFREQFRKSEVGSQRSI